MDFPTIKKEIVDKITPRNDSNEIYEVENLNYLNELKQKEILKKYPKYLPLGSVVILKNAWRKVMIMGFSPIDMDKKDKIYDYLGCLYPEGIIRTDVNILFNHEDIKEIKAIGLIDEEQKEFMSKIDELIGDETKKNRTLEEVKK